MFRIASIATLAAAAALAVAACGSSSPTAGNSTAAQTSAGLAYAQCIRTHGVPQFPDPSAGSSGGVRIQASAGSGGRQAMTVNGVPVNAPAFQKAQNDCAKDLPQGPAVSASKAASIRASALKMAACMRSHGVTNFPDPQVQISGGHVSVGIRVQGTTGGGLNPQSPAFESASKICQPILQKP